MLFSGSSAAIEDLRLLELIRASYTGSYGIYGSPRVFLDLREVGETCGVHDVAKIMKNNGTKAVCGYKTPRAITGRPSIIASNQLNRNFKAERPDQLRVTDTTSIGA